MTDFLEKSFNTFMMYVLNRKSVVFLHGSDVAHLIFILITNIWDIDYYFLYCYNVPLNIFVHMCELLSLGFIPRSEIVRIWDMCILP